MSVLFDRITLYNSQLSRFGKCGNISLPSEACGDTAVEP